MFKRNRTLATIADQSSTLRILYPSFYDCSAAVDGARASVCIRALPSVQHSLKSRDVSSKPILISPAATESVIVDEQQLFYYIVRPHDGSPSDLIASKQDRLNNCADDIEKRITTFARYQDVSAKDHK